MNERDIAELKWLLWAAMAYIEFIRKASNLGDEYKWLFSKRANELLGDEYNG